VFGFKNDYQPKSIFRKVKNSANSLQIPTILAKGRKKESKPISVTGHGGLKGCEMWGFPHF
jgi:hypothetical protein